jgi:ATP-dependent DNA ligase
MFPTAYLLRMNTMQEEIIPRKIDEYKPDMKALEKVRDVVPLLGKNTVLMAKVDGEFTLLHYDREGQSYTLNRWGKARMSFPALDEFVNTLNKTAIKKAEILCELYAMENGLPLKLNKFISYIKSHNDTIIANNIFIGIWDLLSVNGFPIKEPYAWRISEVRSWIRECRLVHVLPHIQPQTIEDVEDFWQTFVNMNGYEGIVVRPDNGIYKLKPIHDLDAVIIGINKKNKYEKGFNLFDKENVTTMKLALMEEDGTLIEVSDVASGIDHTLRKALWQLMEFKVEEDNEVVWIQPCVVVKLQYTELFITEGSNRLKFTGSSYMKMEKRPFVRLRNPRLLGFRPDKEVNPQALRVSQIPERYLTDYYAWKKNIQS